MIQRAIVLAHRLHFNGGSISPAAVALLRRTLGSLAQLGVRDVCVVDGEQADILRDRLTLDELRGMRVEVRFNRSWKRNSGSAVLVARDFLTASDEPCLVLRGDRPLNQETLAELAGADLGDHDAIVVVADPEPSLSSELTNETKVLLRRESSAGQMQGTMQGTMRIAAMDLDLDRYDALFTGHVLCDARILRHLEALPNPTLADGIQGLGRSGTVRALPGRITWPWGMRSVEVDDNVAALLESKEHPHYTLMNPGPVKTTAQVKSALVHHDVSHRDSSFSELMVSLTGKLRRVFRGSSEHTVVMVTGSGTAAMECAISSTVPTDRKILIVDNGAFGERLYEISRLHEMDIVHLRYAWGDVVNPADVRRAFEAHPDIAVVAMIHHETSVGLLNPVTEVGAICRERDALFIVDAVSSLGAEDIDVVRDNVDVCYASANKCLHAISGAGFLCVSPRTWQKIESVKPRTYYLDLKKYRRYMDDLAQTPFTPAVSNYFALDAACDEFLADGGPKRRAMYKARNERLRRGLADLGMVPFTRTGRESHSVVTCAVPNGVQFQDLYKGLKERGYIVYGCKDVLADKFLQVANMGDLDAAMLDQFLAAAREVIAELRAKAPVVPATVTTQRRRVSRAS